MTEAEKTPRTHTEPLPRSLEELVSLFKRGVSLPDVEEIRVTPKEFHIRRKVEDGQPVLPGDEAKDDVDPSFVLERIELDELPFDPDAHPYHNAEMATRMVTLRGLIPMFFFAPEGPWVAAYFDLPDNPPPSHVFGMRVIYSQSDAYREKFVVVGSTTQYLSDSSYGVIIDMGV